MHELKTPDLPLCETCLHDSVCALEAQFEAAQKAIDNVSVWFHPGIAHEKGMSKLLSSIDWIEPVRVKCKHYLEADHGQA